MNKELKEAVKVLKEIQETNRAWLKETEEKNCEKIYLGDIEAIEIVLKELERLQEENSKLETANKTYINSIQSITPVLLEDYIEKDKIREKIREQKELMEKYRKLKEYGQVDIRLYKIQILKELLEGK